MPAETISVDSGKGAHKFLRGVSAVVATDPLWFGLARVWQSLAEDIGWRVQIFHSRAEAILWLRTQLGEGNPNSPLLDAYPSLQREQ